MEKVGRIAVSQNKGKKKNPSRLMDSKNTNDEKKFILRFRKH